MPKVTAQLQAESFSDAAGQNATASFANSYCWSDSSTLATCGEPIYSQGNGYNRWCAGTGIIFDNGAASISQITRAISTTGAQATWSYVNTNPANQWAGSPHTTLADALYRLTNTINALYGLPIP